MITFQFDKLILNYKLKDSKKLEVEMT
jgi:hypothetical protein